jgi:hypothetical protein
VLEGCRRLLLAAAVATHKEAAIPVDAHGCAAAAAVGHDGIIGEGVASDPMTCPCWFSTAGSHRSTQSSEIADKSCGGNSIVAVVRITTHKR